ncbi:MAG TPA: AAA domain-containing protein [Micromonosporaceae bacterium]
MPDWRDEVCGALNFWIGAVGGGRSERQIPVGKARQESEPGWYVVDTRGTDRAWADPDQVESLFLKDSSRPDGPTHPVMEAVRDGPLLRVRVAAFVSLNHAYLYQNKQPPAHLLRKLREGIAGLVEPGLADDLAAGRLAAAPRIRDPVAGFTATQQEAYESCLATGVRLVWGPPGTGKTRVLAEAIRTLSSIGKRVLLVSATNIAVDNALLGAVDHRRERGVLLRVGPPHHPDVLAHPELCLTHLVRTQLAEIEQRRRAVEERLLRMREEDDELARLRERLDGFDEREYRLAKRLLSAEAEIPTLAEAAARLTARAQECQRAAERRRADLVTAEQRVRELSTARSTYMKIDRLEQDLASLAAATDELNAKALTASHQADQIEAELRRLEGDGAFARLRNRLRIKQQRAALDAARQQAAEYRRRADNASLLLDRRRAVVRAQIGQLSSTARWTREDVAAADAALAAARRAFRQAEDSARRVDDELARAQQALLAAEAGPRPTEAQRALAERADRQQLPSLATKVTELQARQATNQVERSRLEEEHAKLQERFDRHRRNAEGEIIWQAKVVATTLARLRTTKALLDGAYDVVLVDEVGAANLPEVLLAVSRAKQAAVLFGDFRQLGAVIDKAVQDCDRADVRRWLATDVFAHCGITTAKEAQRHRGCTALDVQHRFGPEIMGLVNVIAYDGLLQPGPGVRAHDDDDPEIVLIDTDGLDDLGRVRPTSRSAGWWPAGALLSRVLADYHQARGEKTGIVAPYADQVAATLEALRDQESATKPITEVGTAHRFQGREFPIVVFDMVEDAERARWIAKASLRGETWERDGVRLFNVAVTRTRTRLYLIGSRQRVNAAPSGSPLAEVAALLRDRRARAVPATRLITPTAAGEADRLQLGPFSRELSELLAEHVRVTDIHDERGFYRVFAEHLEDARRSVWIWAPWTTSRVESLLPVLSRVVARGVEVTLFVRSPRDGLQGRPDNQIYLNKLRELLHTVVEINEMHQKIVVIDEETVLLGSLNALSQSRTREVMLTVRGAHFARKLLEHEHAKTFAAPPRCGACGDTKIDLRRGKSDWYWRCYSETCPARSKPGRKAWVQPAFGGTSRRATSSRVPRRPGDSHDDATG